MGIKVIESAYNGYRFRSRLEARWAVFLDTVGITYRYEPEGFDLGGLWYLPDFWLPSLRTWLEIKPEVPTGDDAEKVIRFHEAIYSLPDGQSQNVYVLAGEPFANGWDRSYDVYFPYAKPRGFRKSNQLWTHCPLCGTIDLADTWPGYSHEEDGSSWDGISCMSCDIGDSRDRPPRDPRAYFHKGIVTGPTGSIHASPLLIQGYHAARSARFERAREVALA
jgi:hypothetical protein